MNKISNYTTAPTAYLEQRDEYDCPIENPITISFYNGSVSIEQNGHSIALMDENIPEFIRLLKKYREEANTYLKLKRS